MAEEEKSQDEQGGPPGTDPEGEEEPQDKISLVEIILVGSLLGFSWLLGLIPIAGYPFSLLASGGLSIYAKFRIKNPAWAWGGSVGNIVPVFNWVPWVAIGYAIAIYDHNNPGKLDKLTGGVSKIAKTAESVSSSLKGKGAEKEGGKGVGPTTATEAGREVGQEAGTTTEAGVSTGSSSIQDQQPQSQAAGGRKTGEGEGGESINPEMMGSMSKISDTQEQKYPPKDQEGDESPLKSAPKSPQQNSVGENAEPAPETSPGIEDLDMIEESARSRVLQSQKAGRQTSIPKPPVPLPPPKPFLSPKAIDGVVPFEKMGNRNVLNMSAPIPNKGANPSQRNQNDVELNGKQVDLRKAA